MDVELAGVAFHALTEDETVDRVRDALARGTGGRILTPHVDILRQDPARFARVRDAVLNAQPDLVFVGLGFPRQEEVISRLRPELPRTWFLGCGAAIDFVAGDRRRAPGWMRRNGLEWLYRLGTEPRRL